MRSLDNIDFTHIGPWAIGDREDGEDGENVPPDRYQDEALEDHCLCSSGFVSGQGPDSQGGAGPSTGHGSSGTSKSTVKPRTKVKMKQTNKKQARKVQSLNKQNWQSKKPQLARHFVSPNLAGPAGERVLGSSPGGGD